MKKYISLLLVVFILLGVFCGCGNGTEKETKLSVVTTIFPEYDWVMNILGEKSNDVEVTMLLDSGVDLHSYQPTADDIIKISKCDVFIYIGGESDEWVEDALKEAVNRDMIVIDLLESLGENAKYEEAVEGMEAEEEEEEEYDEHIWLSLKNAVFAVETIRDAIMKADGENADLYSENAAKYIEKLNELDEKYKSAAENANIKTVLFGDRFPFRYLMDDYGIEYYAAFSGCSAESEASFETVAFLANKVDELKLPAVLTLEGSSEKIAETVVATTGNSNAEILCMNSMQSTTLSDAQNGANYLSIMEYNLEILEKALNKEG